MKVHTKFRAKAIFGVGLDQESHREGQTSGPQERWNSIQQTRSLWRSYLCDRASITRCKAVARYRERETKARSQRAKITKRKSVEKKREARVLGTLIALLKKLTER